jgi:hypothetical protein
LDEGKTNERRTRDEGKKFVGLAEKQISNCKENINSLTIFLIGELSSSSGMRNTFGSETCSWTCRRSRSLYGGESLTPVIPVLF